MNCKPGDLAVFVRSEAGNEGRIVRCIRLSRSPLMLLRGGLENMGHVWKIEPSVRGWNGELTDAAPDEYLRPIRDNDGEDEMLRIVGKPEPVSA